MNKVAANSPFVLADLESQSNAVSRHVKGWKKEDILSWLADRDNLRVLTETQGPGTFGFESVQGFRSLFFLDGDQFTFI